MGSAQKMRIGKINQFEERTGRKLHKSLAQILAIARLIVHLASLVGVNCPKHAHHVICD